MSGETILVVEDNDLLREGISEMLTIEGFHVVRACNGADAVESLRHTTPDLILSDVMMPEMDGFDLYTSVRSQSHLVSVPFIFLTARTDPADYFKSRMLGADDYLAKPVTRDELVTSIRSRLGRYSQVKLAQIQQAYQASLTMLADAIESRGPTQYGHIERLTEIALIIGQYLRLNNRALNQLRFGAILHDIGKLNIAEEILFKAGPLTEEEWTEIKRHPVAGAEMVRGIAYFADVAPIIRHHHERWDGQGYPDGLAGLEIPIGARVLAVVDSFDAMVSDRSYAPARTHTQAYEEILRLSGQKYDPKVIEALEKAWMDGKIQHAYAPDSLLGE